MNRNFGRGNLSGGLESIRARYGNERMKSYFTTIAARSRQQAVALVNDRELMFYTLYQLLPEIEAQGLASQLNMRNLTAIRLSAKALNNQQLLNSLPGVPETDEETHHGVLKWILKTGAADDGAENSFDRVLDSAAALLSNRYKDAKMLPVMADIIFRRNQKGLLIHDISWAYFASRDPVTLRLAAGYLRSSDEKDYLLACHLLSLQPTIPEERPTAQQQQYTDYMNWLNENYEYLYYSCESFQFTGEPRPFLINPAAKYLGKPISPVSNAPLTPFTDEENLLLAKTEVLTQEQLVMLADYSSWLRKQNVSRWKAFLSLTAEEQLTIASTAAGGAI